MTAHEPGRPEPSRRVPLLRRVAGHGQRPAVADGDGEHGYADLRAAAGEVAAALLATGDGRAGPERAGPEGPGGTPVAFMLPPGAGYVATLLGVWKAGGIAVPLCLSHPPRELAHVLDDTGAPAAIVHPEYEEVLGPLAEERGVALLPADRLPTAARSTAADAPVAPEARDRPALIMYTSGTTGRPKGVLHTHRSLEAQIRSLVEAWEWRPDDRILHALPLHHTHGIVNALLCALWTGATCEMLPRFDAGEVWNRIASGRPTLFMGVPTMYVRLIRAWEAADDRRRRALSRAAEGLRLTVSGSAALPVPVFERWEEIAGEPPLERYGMTEIGMALSNPLHGERRAGHVGRPLPGVEVRLVDDDGLPVEEGTPGEIEVRGPTLFREYWERPGATREAFRNGWFATGDEAVVEKGDYRILGRKSVDIINTGGYKVSALEVEEVLLRHPGVEDCAVVGVSDPEWGERVCAAVVPRGGRAPDAEELRAWGKERLAPYKVPTRVRAVEELPRNAVGKVTKPDVVELFRDSRPKPTP